MAYYCLGRLRSVALARKASAETRSLSTRTHVSRLDPLSSAARESPVPIALISSPFFPVHSLENQTTLASTLSAAGFTVGLVDLPGFGKAKALPSAWTLDDVVADWHEAMVTSLAAPPVAITHSATAVLVQKYLESWPVAGLVAIAPLPPTQDECIRRWPELANLNRQLTPQDVASALRAMTLDENSVRQWLCGMSADDEVLSNIVQGLESLAVIDVAQMRVGRRENTPLCGFDAAGKYLADMLASPVNLEPQPVPILVVAPAADALVTSEETQAVLAFHDLDPTDSDAFFQAPVSGHATLCAPALCGDGSGQAAIDHITRWIVTRY